VTILCLNSGSSSLKFALYELGEAETRVALGAVERIGPEPGRLWIRDAGERSVTDAPGHFPDAQVAVHAVFVAVGHRVVHGGPDHAAPERIDARLVASLRRLVPVAPLHLPAELEAIEAVTAHFSGLPQVACLGYHRDLSVNM